MVSVDSEIDRQLGLFSGRSRVASLSIIPFPRSFQQSRRNRALSPSISVADDAEVTVRTTGKVSRTNEYVGPLRRIRCPH